MEYNYLKLKELADAISDEVSSEVSKLSSKLNIASLIVGNDPSSISYQNGMKKRAQKLGADLDIVQLDENISEKKFLEELENYNKNKKYSGIIIQNPLPKHIDPHVVSLTIDPKKDIDCINPYNLGLLFCGHSSLIPATAMAVDLTLNYISKKYSVELTGKNAVVIGRSLTVGKPAYQLLLKKNITPTTVHTKTNDIKSITTQADIIIASCGVPQLITEDWIKKDVIIIDVGIHYVETEDEDGCKLCGDIDKNSVKNKASILTAVPGGIGSVTSVLIFANAVKCWHKINQNKYHSFNFEK